MSAKPIARCGKCGAETAADGACPACMLEAALIPGPLARESDLDHGRRPLPPSFGDYQIIGELARGGMGVVYKARQRSLDRIVAIKMILTGRLADAVELQRFRSEAETAARLRHPNIVAIHEVGEYDGQPFFSMDYVEGPSLAELAHNEPLPGRRAARYLQIIAEAVDYAHSKGVFHRDLKPSNILIDQEDQPRVTDFGLAKRTEGDPSLTMTGQVLGSPSFMPPEQAAGKNAEIVPASDVYSLGAILYHLLTGRPPFVGPSLTQTLRLLAETEPIAPRLLNPATPADLETICLKCLDKAPTRRYASAAALAQDLGRFLRDEPIQARPAGKWEKAWRWCRRHPAVTTLGTAVLALLLTVAVGSSIYASRLKAANQRATEKLRESYIGQAQAERWSGRAGRRARGLELLRNAASIRPSLEIRNEAIACLALVDIRPVKTFGRPHLNIMFDRTYSRYADREKDGAAVIRSTRDDAEIARFSGPSAETTFDLGFSPEGPYFLIYRRAGKRHLFEVWNVERRERMFAFSNRWVRVSEFAENGQQLFLAMDEPSHIVRYSVPSGQSQELFTPSALPFGLRLSPAGDRLAVSSEDSKEVEVRDAASGQLICSLPHPAGVRGLDWSPDGKLLAAGCRDRNIYIWDIASRQPQRVLAGHKSPINGVAFSHDGNRLASCSWDNTFRLWNVWDGRETLSLPCGGWAQHFGPDDRLIALPSSHAISGATDLCEIAADREWRTLQFESTGQPEGLGCEWSPDGRLLISRHKDGLRFWDADKRRQIALPPAGVGEVFDVTLEPSGSNLVASTSTGLYRIPSRWEEAMGCQRLALGAPALVRPDVRASSLALYDGGRVLAATVSGTLRIFEWPGGQDRRTFKLNGGVDDWSVTPDGRLCVGWSWEGNQPRRVWDIHTGAILKDLPSESIYGAAFTPDGRSLLTGSSDEYLAWDTRYWTNTWKVPRENAASAHGCIALTEDGVLGALTLSAQTIRLFEPSSGRELATLNAPEPQTLTSLAFSRNGSRLAGTTQTGVIHVWDLRIIRQELAAMKLDWDAPALPEPPAGP